MCTETKLLNKEAFQKALSAYQEVHSAVYQLYDQFLAFEATSGWPLTDVITAHLQTAVDAVRAETWSSADLSSVSREDIGTTLMITVQIFDGFQSASTKDFFGVVVGFLTGWCARYSPQKSSFTKTIKIDAEGRQISSTAPVNMMPQLSDATRVLPLVHFISMCLCAWDNVSMETQKAFVVLTLSWFDHFWDLIYSSMQTAYALPYMSMHAVLAKMRAVVHFMRAATEGKRRSMRPLAAILAH